MTLNLTLEGREATGSRKMTGLRSEGKLPVVVYGTGVDPGNYMVALGDFTKVFREAGESTLVSLSADGKERDALIHDVQYHPTSGKPIHVDLLLVDANKPVEVSVELVFDGVPPAVKNLGGILVKALHEIQISVLPKELPHSLNIDLTLLEDFDSRIVAKDIQLPPSAELLTDPEEAVALVNAAKEEEEEEAPQSAEEIEAAVKAEGDDKKNEEGEVKDSEK